MACEIAAKGPWASVAHAPDPIGAIRDGREFNVDGALARSDPPDELREFAHADDYRDRSPITTMAPLHRAMVDAGFLHGIEARWGSGHLLAAVDVIQFRDAQAAKKVVTAHLTALCDHTVDFTKRSDGTGLSVTQDDSTVRTIFALGDVEVSVMTCSCYGRTDPERQALLDQWSGEVADQLKGRAKPLGTA